MHALTLSMQTMAKIVEKGRLREPAEAVGIIVHGDKVIELPNRSLTPQSSFLIEVNDIGVELQNHRITMTPDDWLEMVLWHTHPGGTVGPSRTDMRNRIPEITHMVVALTPEGAIPTLY